MPGVQATVVGTEAAALAYIAAVDHEGHLLPKLILLDLYLPTQANGLLALDNLKAYFKARSKPPVPVVMFSYSDNPEDVRTCYDRGLTPIWSNRPITASGAGILSSSATTGSMPLRCPSVEEIAQNGLIRQARFPTKSSQMGSFRQPGSTDLSGTLFLTLTCHAPKPSTLFLPLLHLFSHSRVGNGNPPTQPLSDLSPACWPGRNSHGSSGV